MHVACIGFAVLSDSLISLMLSCVCVWCLCEPACVLYMWSVAQILVIFKIEAFEEDFQWVSWCVCVRACVCAYNVHCTGRYRLKGWRL